MWLFGSCLGRQGGIGMFFLKVLLNRHTFWTGHRADSLAGLPCIRHLVKYRTRTGSLEASTRIELV